MRAVWCHNNPSQASNLKTLYLASNAAPLQVCEYEEGFSLPRCINVKGLSRKRRHQGEAEEMTPPWSSGKSDLIKVIDKEIFHTLLMLLLHGPLWDRQIRMDEGP